MQLHGITADSRLVRPGYAFVAVRGFREDGHRYVAEAVQRGAVLVVAEAGRLGQGAAGVPVIEVDDSRLALAQLAAEFYRHPSLELNVIGVTGTNGKTTTTRMIAHVLRSYGLRCADIGSAGIHTPRSEAPAPLTTPDPVRIQQALSETVRAGGSHAVIEVSSHGLALHRVAEVYFRTAVLTNLSLDHQDFHRGFQEYVETKLRLFRLLDPDGTALLNGDDPLVRGLLPRIDRRTLLFGRTPGCESTAEEITFTAQGLRFRWVFGGGRHDVLLHQIGGHNVLNALAALSAACRAGVPPEKAAEALASFKGVRRRLEIIRLGGATLIDDYAHNPAGYRAAFCACGRLPRRRLLVVASVRGRRGCSINRANASVLGEECRKHKAARLIVTDSEDAVGEYDRVHPEEREVFLRVLKKTFPAPPGIILHYPALREALSAALDDAGPGDLILLLGAQGMDRAAGLLSTLWREGRSAGSFGRRRRSLQVSRPADRRSGS